MRPLFLLLTLILSIQFFYGHGKCTGSEFCSACETCNYCKHCAKNGGSCGICGGGDRGDHHSSVNLSEKKSFYGDTQNSENNKSWESYLVIFLLIIIGLLFLRIVLQKPGK
ncbi:hypothetical protein AOB46_11635 [Chryseobacterium indologenes]|uniref:Uncharacterized protein n=1 Tax=Chryseobacterium indologenes TaxID=253 RepID=A0A0N0ZU89_CHRID|nr:hypothetical protein AOB46_11635 [Chryseobacterium indologenes]